MPYPHRVYVVIASGLIAVAAVGAPAVGQTVTAAVVEVTAEGGTPISTFGPSMEPGATARMGAKAVPQRRSIT